MAITVATLIAHVGADVTQFMRGMSRANKGLLGFQGVLGKISKGMMVTGVGLTAAVTAPILGIGKSAIDAASEWEDAFTGVRKTVEGSEDQLLALDKALRRLTERIPIDHTDLARIAEIAGQLGTPIDEIEAFSEVIAALGVATDLGFEDAAMGMARYLNVTKSLSDLSPEEQLRRTADVLVALGNNVAATEEEILQMTQYMAGMSVVAGVNQEDIMGLSAGLAALGIRSQVGGSTVSRVFAEMDATVRSANESFVDNTAAIEKMSEKAAKTARQIEIVKLQMAAWTDKTKDHTKASQQLHLDTLNAQLADQVQILDDLNASQGKLVDGGKLQEFARVAGMTADDFEKAYKEDATMALQAFIVGLDKVRQEGGDVKGILEGLDLSTIRLDQTLLTASAGYETLAEAIGIARDAYQEQGRVMSEAELRARGITDGLKGSGDDIIAQGALVDEATKKYETFSSRVQTVQSAINNVKIAMGKPLLGVLKSMLESMMPTIQAWTEWIEAHQQDAVVAAKIALIVAALGPLVALVGALISPIGLVISGIALLGAAFVQSQGGIVGAKDKIVEIYNTIAEFLAGPIGEMITGFAQVWAIVSTTLAPVVAKIEDGLKILGAAFLGLISGEGSKIISWFRDNWPLILETVQTISDGVVNVFEWAWPKVEAIFSAVWPLMSGIMGAGVTEILGLFKAIMQAVNGDWDGAWETVGDTMSSVWAQVSPVLTDFWEKIGNWLGIPALIETAWSGIADWFAPIWDSIAAGIDSVIAAITGWLGLDLDAIKVLWDEIKNAFLTVVNVIIGTAVALWAGLRTLFDGGVSALVAVIEWFADVLGGTWENVKELFISSFKMIWDALGDIIGGFINFIVGMVTAFLQLIRGDFGAAWETLKTTVFDAFKQIMDGLGKLLLGLLALLGSIAAYIVQAFFDIVRSVGDLVRGIKEAIDEALQSTWDWLTSIDLVDEGLALVKGFIEGIASGATDVVEKIKELADDIVTSVKSFLGIDSPSTIFKGIGENVVKGLINGITGLFGETENAGEGLLSKLLGTFDGLKSLFGENFMDVIMQGINAVRDFMAEQFSVAIQFLYDTITPIWTMIWEDAIKISLTLMQELIILLSEFRQDFFRIGQMIMESMRAGIVDKAKAMAQAAVAAVRAAIAAAEAELQIGSPSKVFMDIGENIMKGLELGIDKDAMLPVDATSRVAQSVVNQYQRDYHLSVTQNRVSEYASLRDMVALMEAGA
jgi:phage-related protein